MDWKNWSTRVYNHDETPQFINYGVDGTPNGLVFAGGRESCKKMMRENRECVTINPVVSLSGIICVCQVIFGTKGITNQMALKEAVEKIDNLLISTTDNGCQDHTSLLACYKLFDKYLDRTYWTPCGPNKQWSFLKIWLRNFEVLQWEKDPSFYLATWHNRCNTTAWSIQQEHLSWIQSCKRKSFYITDDNKSWRFHVVIGRYVG